MDLQVSPVFLKNYEYYQKNYEIVKRNAGLPEDQRIKSPYRIVVNQGSSRSSKTYSIIQLISLIIGQQRTGLLVDIAGKTRVGLRDKVLDDFKEILDNSDLWDDRNFNKTELRYHLNGNVFRFIGMDKAIRKRSTRRDILYINEANELSLEDWIQLSIRTSEWAVMDFNPSEEFWVNDHVFTRDDHKLIKSTYLDNYDFLPSEQIAEIENLINVDEYYYRVYALGEFATPQGLIYQNFEVVPDYIYDQIVAETWYGLDFGWDDPNSLTEIKWHQERVYIDEVFYGSKTQIVNTPNNPSGKDDLVTIMARRNIRSTDEIYCDHNPAFIRQLQEAGYKALHADKEDLHNSIMFVQQLPKFYITQRSINTLKEHRKYKWKQDANGKIHIGVPVDIDNHSCDSARYGIYSHLKKRIKVFGIKT